MHRRYLKIFLISLMLAYASFLMGSILTNPQNYQNDFKVYYYSARAYYAGLNPYDSNDVSLVAPVPINHKFIYSPAVLFLFSFLSNVEYTSAFYLFLGFKCLALAGLILLWKNSFLPKGSDPAFYLFCLLAFNGSLYIDIAAGNISIIEQLILWLAFYFLIKNRFAQFCILIVFASLFKVTPILFLFLLLFSEGNKRYFYFFAAWTFFMLLMFVSYKTNPLHFASYYDNIRHVREVGIVNPATLPLLEDIFGYLSIKPGISLPSGFPLAAYLMIVAGVVGITLRGFISVKSWEAGEKEKLLIFVFCIVYAIILPRFKDYSYILLVVPAYYLIRKVSLKSVYPLLFIIITLSSVHVTLPLADAISGILWNYFPLIVAYCIWGLYMHEIHSRGRTAHG